MMRVINRFSFVASLWHGVSVVRVSDAASGATFTKSSCDVASTTEKVQNRVRATALMDKMAAFGSINSTEAKILIDMIDADFQQNMISNPVTTNVPAPVYHAAPFRIADLRVEMLKWWTAEDFTCLNDAALWVPNAWTTAPRLVLEDYLQNVVGLDTSKQLENLRLESTWASAVASECITRYMFHAGPTAPAHKFHTYTDARATTAVRDLWRLAEHSLATSDKDILDETILRIVPFYREKHGDAGAMSVLKKPIMIQLCLATIHSLAVGSVAEATTNCGLQNVMWAVNTELAFGNSAASTRNVAAGTEIGRLLGEQKFVGKPASKMAALLHEGLGSSAVSGFDAYFRILYSLWNVAFSRWYFVAFLPVASSCKSTYSWEARFQTIFPSLVMPLVAKGATVDNGWVWRRVVSLSAYYAYNFKCGGAPELVAESPTILAALGRGSALSSTSGDSNSFIDDDSAGMWVLFAVMVVVAAGGCFWAGFFFFRMKDWLGTKQADLGIGKSSNEAVRDFSESRPVVDSNAVLVTLPAVGEEGKKLHN